MYKGKKVSLVIPAYNERKLIKPTLENVPKTVDQVYVIDDGSRDGMHEVVEQIAKNDNRIRLIRHLKNRGVGASIITGYKQSVKDDYDIAVVIGGDYQMDLADLPNFLEPLIKGEADYTKGNRFLYSQGIPEIMPFKRKLGNSVLSLMTKIASGYYHLFDTMDGYTAITKEAIQRVDWRNAWKGYGYPADFLVVFNTFGLKVKDVPRRAIYLKGERQSQIKVIRYVTKVSPLLVEKFFWRLWNKYVLRDFHPLVFFYFLSFVLLPLGMVIGFWLVYRSILNLGFSNHWVVLSSFLLIMGLQSLFFAMMFDMQQSK